jgi:hypothetical protein
VFDLYRIRCSRWSGFYTFEWIDITASDIDTTVRYFHGESLLPLWSGQYIDFKNRQHDDYIIFKEMSRLLTFPFPPILLDTSGVEDDGWRKYGRPLHLIEGTHRTSYIVTMNKLGIIDGHSKHRFVIVKIGLANF